TSLRALGMSLLWPFAIADGAGVVLLAFGAGSNAGGVIAYTFAIFVLAAIALEFIRGTRARKALGDQTWPGAFSSLVGRNRRRYGGYIVHAAIVLLAIGIARGAHGATKARHRRPGDTIAIRGHNLTYPGPAARD